MKKVLNYYCYPIANSSDIALFTDNSMRRISSTDFLELMLAERDIKGLTI